MRGGAISIGAADYYFCKKCDKVEYGIERSYGKFICDECENAANTQSLYHTQITPDVRVSTATLRLSHNYGYYKQVETWIFSNDPRQRTVQIIHGTYGNGDLIPWSLREKALRAHNVAVFGLRKKLIQGGGEE